MSLTLQWFTISIIAFREPFKVGFQATTEMSKVQTEMYIEVHCGGEMNDVGDDVRQSQIPASVACTASLHILYLSTGPVK